MTTNVRTRCPSVHLILTSALLIGAVSCVPAGDRDRIVTHGVVNDDLLTAGRQVRVEGEVKGDVAAAGAMVTIAAPVDGYIMSAGRTVTIEGPVGDDVWAAGGRVSIDGRVADNAMVAGRYVHLGAGTTIGHDARLAGGEVRSEGRIVRNLSIGAGTAEIGGDIGGVVRANAQEVRVLPGAVVRGDLIVRSPEPPVISPEAKVLGNVQYEAADRSARWLSWPLMWIGSFLALLLLGAAVLALAPSWTARVAETMRTRTLRSMLIGLVVLVCVPIVAALLVMTLIGIPLAAAMAALYVAVLLLSGAFVSYEVGEWLLARAHKTGVSRWAALTLGALVVSIGLSLPWVGGILALLVVLAGAGALTLERRAHTAIAAR